MDALTSSCPICPVSRFWDGTLLPDTMQSILNVTVSCFANFKTPDNPKPVNLLQWLTNAKYWQRQSAIRAMATKAERDAAKETLPAITPSGEFTRREGKALIKHSGIICLDIDLKGNEGIRNYSDLKVELSKISNVAYCGLSVSGTGVFVLIPIKYPEQHESQFNALRQLFQDHFGVRIDATGDVSRLRGYSYEPDAYFKHNAKPFGGLYTPPKPKPTPRKTRNYGPSSVDTTRGKVEDVINQLHACNRDITDEYSQWFAIGCALANEFGESGREYYHAVSQHHPDYQDEETDKKFDSALETRYNYSIGTFFKYAELAGFVPTRHHRNELAQVNPVKRVASEGHRVGSALPPLSILNEPPPAPATDARLTNTWKRDGELIHGEALTVELCELATAQQPDEPPIDPVDTSIVRGFTDLNGNKFSIKIGQHGCPADWDEPNPPGVTPTIKEVPLTDAKAFHQWQQQHSYFSQHGLASLKK